MNQDTNPLKLDKEKPFELTVLHNGLNTGISSYLLEHRIITFETQVDQQSAGYLQKALLALDQLKFKGKKYQDIHLYINSYGGSVYSLLAMHDTMQYIKSDVSTICTGVAMSAGAAMLISGASGKRFVLPYSTIMFHELSTGNGYDRYSQLQVNQRETDRLNEVVTDLIIQHVPRDKDNKILNWGWDPHYTDKDIIEEDINSLTEKEAREWFSHWTKFNRYLNPQQAMKMGFIDGIIKTKDKLHYNLEDEK